MMRLPRVRFTIRTLMAAILVVAALLVIPVDSIAILAFLTIPCMAIVGAWRLVPTKRRRVATFCFGAAAIWINALYVAVCSQPDYMLAGGLQMLWPLVTAPTILALGAAWGRLATWHSEVPRRTAAAAWLIVLGLAVLPLATCSTFWPLRLAFVAARPALDGLARQAASGQAVVLPQEAGIFVVRRIDVDPGSGNMALIVDPHPGGLAGFVQTNPRIPWSRGAPIAGSGLAVALGGGWEFRQDD